MIQYVIPVLYRNLLNRECVEQNMEIPASAGMTGYVLFRYEKHTRNMSQIRC